MTSNLTNSAHQRPRADDRTRSLWQALRDCPLLSSKTPERDHLWLVVMETVCTWTSTRAVPYGSTTPVEITPDYAHDEAISAMDWLHTNEVRARTLDPDHLYAALRAVATRGSHGSARAAQLDLLHGMTDVPPGDPVRWLPLDEDGAA